MLSGALAGLGGMSEVTGVVHRLQTSPHRCRIWFYRHHRGMAGKAESAGDYSGIHPVWGVDIGRT